MDWLWVRKAFRDTLSAYGATEAITSLAEGSDQAFAEVALEMDIPLTAIVPVGGYDSFFDNEEALLNYRRLLGRARRKNLELQFPSERAFFEAGKYIVDNCDVLVAVWDGKPAEGLGGTADVVHYARVLGRRMVWLDPLSSEIHREGAAR